MHIHSKLTGTKGFVSAHDKDVFKVSRAVLCYNY